MADLKITDDILDELQSGLKSIVDTFQGASQFSNEIEGLVGHSGLAHQVHDFASDWKVHRDKMVDGLVKLHDHVTVINTGFTQADKDLAQPFDGTSSSAAPETIHGKGTAQ